MRYNENAKLIKKEQIKNDIYKFTLQTEKIAKESKPGNFIEMKVADTSTVFLRRPISIFNIDGNNIEVIFQVKGKGTELLAKKQEGEEIDILGPLGFGTFKVDNFEKVAIIGGGIGVFPLYELAKELKGKAKINTYLGFRSKDFVVTENEFKVVSNKLVITTDDGSYGEKGFAIDFMKNDEKPDMIYACGPLPMLKAVKAYADENNIPCQVSLEERMGCGIGACLGCAVKIIKNGEEKYGHVCKEGPVFYSKDVEI